MATTRRIAASPRSILALVLLIPVIAIGVRTGNFPPGGQANADAARIVSLYADGQKRVVTTDAPTVGDLLKRVGVVLAPHDTVEPTARTAIPEGYFNVNVYRARPVTVVDGMATYHIVSAAQSDKGLAEDAGLTVYPEDTFDTQMITDFVGDGGVGAKLIIHRATPFSVSVDGQELALRSQSQTIGGALTDGGVKVGPQDIVEPAVSQPLLSGQHVTITRVSEVVTTVNEVLPKTVQKVTDPTMARGTTQIKTAGSDGHRTVTYRIHYHDGVEVARETLNVADVVQPVTEVLAIGTKVIFAGNIEYWRPYVTQAAAQYGVDPNLMLAIMKCESGGNAASINSASVNGQHAEGLFQFLPSTWASYGQPTSTIFDGPTQIQVAAGRLSLPNGTSPWAASEWCWGSYEN